jgi:hypothetical protein
MNIPRREFLKKSALGVGGVLVGAQLGAAESAPTKTFDPYAHHRNGASWARAFPLPVDERWGRIDATCHLVVTADTVTVRSPGAPLIPVTVEQMQAFTAPMYNRSSRPVNAGLQRLPPYPDNYPDILSRSEESEFVSADISRRA